MTLPINKIATKEKFFGQKIYLESSGNKLVDESLCSVFRDHYNKTAPLTMDREDVRTILDWQAAKREANDTTNK